MLEPRSTDLDVDSATEAQEIRAFLRERFLRVLTSPILVNKECDFNMFGNTKIRAVFVASNIVSSTFAVRDLATKLGVIPSALLRAQDIVSLQVRVPKEAITS